MGFLEGKDRGSYCSDGVKCFIEAVAVAVKDTIQILTVYSDSGVVSIR